MTGNHPARARQDAELSRRIIEIHRESGGTYGAPRIHAELKYDYGIRCSKKRVARLMRQANLVGVHRRRLKGCTKRDPERPSYPDLVQRSFVADAPNQLWVADITQHSDHGSQYTSLVFSKRLEEAGILGSMGSVGDALDNAVAESFYATLQTELLDRNNWPSRQSLRSAIFVFIEAFYNRRRRHSSLDYLSPFEFEERWFNQAKLRVTA